MPACTGLPPGESISSTTAWVPSSSKALRIEEITCSALASVSDAISPLISTTAVCGLETSAGAAPRSQPAQTRPSSTTSQAMRMPLRQRRATRCSCRLANNSFSMAARSHWPPWGAGPALTEAGGGKPSAGCAGAEVNDSGGVTGSVMYGNGFSNGVRHPAPADPAWQAPQE